MTIIPHTFQDSHISQLAEDTIIGGKPIPKGYVNATQLCKAYNKRLSNWTRLDAAKAYITALEASTQIRAYSLLIETEGSNDERGTWAHPEVAIDIARWISPDFAVWANRVLRAVINGDFAPLTADAAISQQKLIEIWAEIREHGKTTRRTLTDAIKDYLLKHDGALSDSYKQWIYKNVSDALNIRLFGKTAKALCEERGCARDRLRDTHTAAQLNLVDRVEALAMLQIDKRDLEPMAALTMALDAHCL